jgi:hypothetical protein
MPATVILNFRLFPTILDLGTSAVVLLLLAAAFEHRQRFLLRRMTYDLLGLQVTVGRGGAVSLEWELDAGAVRYTREVEEYVHALEEAGARPPGGESDLTVAARFEVVREEMERVDREGEGSFLEWREIERFLARASTNSASARTPTARARRAARGGLQR